MPDTARSYTSSSPGARRAALTLLALLGVLAGLLVPPASARAATACDWQTTQCTADAFTVFMPTAYEHYARDADGGRLQDWQRNPHLDPPDAVPFPQDFLDQLVDRRVHPARDMWTLDHYRDAGYNSVNQGNVPYLWQFAGSIGSSTHSLGPGSSITLRAPRPATGLPDTGVTFPSDARAYRLVPGYSGCGYVNDGDNPWTFLCDPNKRDVAEGETRGVASARVSANGVTLTLPADTSIHGHFTVFVAGVVTPPAATYLPSEFTLTTSLTTIPRRSDRPVRLTPGRPSSDHSTLTVPGPTPVTTQTAQPAVATVVLRDRVNNPVPGVGVQVDQRGTTTSAGFVPVEPGDGPFPVTDAIGTVQYQVRDTVAEDVRVFARIDVDPPLFVADKTLTFIAGPPVPPNAAGPDRSSIRFAPGSGAANSYPADRTPRRVTVALVDEYGNEGAGHAVLLTGATDYAAEVTPVPGGTCVSSVVVKGAACADAQGRARFDVVLDRATPSGGSALRVSDITTGTSFAYDPADPATHPNAFRFRAVPPDAGLSDVAVVGPSTVNDDGLSTAEVRVDLRAGAFGFFDEEVELETDSGTAVVTPVQRPAQGCSDPVAAGRTNCQGSAFFTVRNAVRELVVLRALSPQHGVTVERSVVLDFRPVTSMRAVQPTVVLPGPAEIVVTVRDGQDQAAAGARVVLADEAGSASYGGTTGADGTVSILVGRDHLDSPAPGRVVYRARIFLPRDGGSPCPPTTREHDDRSCELTTPVSTTITYVNPPRSGADLTTLTVSPDAAPVFSDGLAFGTVKATARDAAGAAIAGLALRLVERGSGGDPRSVITPVDLVTDANGTFSWQVQSLVEDVFTYEVLNDSQRDPVTLEPLFLPSTPPQVSVRFKRRDTEATMSTVEANPVQLAADGQSTALVTVRLLDADGQRLPNRQVLLAAQRTGPSGSSGGSGTVRITQVASAEPDAAATPNGTTSPIDGRAYFRVADTVAEDVLLIATDAVSGVTIEQTALVSFSTQATRSTVEVEPRTVPVTTPATVLVTLLDADGTPLPGRTVSLTPSRSDVSVSPAAVSDDAGKVEFTVAAGTPGDVVFTARDTSSGVVLAQRPVLVVTETPTQANQSRVTATPTELRATAATATVLVRLRSAAGEPLGGRVVTLEGDRPDAVITPRDAGEAGSAGPVRGTTDDAGDVLFDVRSDTSGPVRLTATDTTAQPPVVLNDRPTVTFLPAPSQGNQSTVVVNPERISADGPGATVVVTLLGADRAPIAGHEVSLATGSAATTVTAARDGRTDLNGVARFTVTGSSVETVTLTASDVTSRVLVEQRPTLSITPATSEAAQSTVTANPAEVVADGRAQALVSVVLQEQGRAVRGSTVRLEQVGGTAAVLAVRDVTDDFGVAQFSLRSTELQSVTVRAVDVTRRVTVLDTAVVAFVQGRPRITSLSPDSGPAQQGRWVTITGTDLLGATEVLWDGRPLTPTEVTRTSLVVLAPARGEGTVGVSVVTPQGTSAPSAAATYRYEPLPPPNPPPAGPDPIHAPPPTSAEPSATPSATPGGSPSASPSGGPGEQPSAGPSRRPLTVPSQPPALRDGAFHPLAPVRVLDTRAARSTLGPAAVLRLEIAGRAGVPTDATSVVLSVTGLARSAATFVTVWPSGVERPLASNLNLGRGDTTANLVQVPLGADGAVSIYNLAGRTDVVVDVQGWTGRQRTAGEGLLNVLPQARLLDTRTTPRQPLAPGETRVLPVLGRAGVPERGVGAVVLNVTSVAGTAATHLTVFPSGSVPTASNLNAPAGRTVAGRVLARVGPDGAVRVYNDSGRTHVLVDVAAWFTDGSDPFATGLAYTAVTPQRVLDTRTDGGALQAQEARRLRLAGTGPVPASGAALAVLNLTATHTTASSFLTAYPAGGTRPDVSDLNWARGSTVANLAYVPLDPTGALELFTASGAAHVIADLGGYYS